MSSPCCEKLRRACSGSAGGGGGGTGAGGGSGSGRFRLAPTSTAAAAPAAEPHTAPPRKSRRLITCAAYPRLWDNAGAQDVPSVKVSTPSPQWADAVARGRQVRGRPAARAGPAGARRPDSDPRAGVPADAHCRLEHADDRADGRGDRGRRRPAQPVERAAGVARAPVARATCHSPLPFRHFRAIGLGAHGTRRYRGPGVHVRGGRTGCPRVVARTERRARHLARRPRLVERRSVRS